MLDSTAKSAERERERDRKEHQLLSRCKLLERNDNRTVLDKETPSACIRAGQASNEGSQAGMTYYPDGIFPTICACTHGYAIGNILVRTRD